MDKQCNIVRQDCQYSGKWLKLQNVHYTDPKGRNRIWESVARTTKHGESADAVVVMATLKRLLKYDCMVLVKQFRPALGTYSLEFPAGLVDEGESAEQAAVRELKEETGYTATVKHCSPEVCLDAGTENTTVVLVTAEIDGDGDENVHHEPSPEETEFIDVILVPTDELLSTLNVYGKQGVVVDSRVYTYAIALAQASKMRPAQPALMK